MNLTIKILNAYNNYQNKIFKKINKLNKDLKKLNNIESKILQVAGSYENVNTFPKLQLNLELLKYLVTPDEINKSKELLNQIEKTRTLTINIIDIMSSKMKVINDVSNNVISSTIDKKKNEIELYNIIKKHNIKTLELLKEKKIIHPLLIDKDMGFLQNILDALIKIKQLKGEQNIKNAIEHINTDYKILIHSILINDREEIALTYSSMSSAIIKSINKLLISYLDVYIPLNNNYRDFGNNLSTQNIGISFIWDSKDHNFNKQTYYDIKRFEINSSIQEMGIQETGDSSPPPPPPRDVHIMKSPNLPDPE